MSQELEYEELPDEISFEGFDFESYYTHEDTLLRPQLETLGFYGITWSMGEYDSFGPLTRVCICTDKDNKRRRFIYG